MSTRQQQASSSLNVAQLTPRLLRKRVRGRFPKWKRSAQSLLSSLIEKTGKDATWWISGYRYSRARNGDHSSNPIWQLKALLAEQWAKGELEEEDLTKVEVHFMSFCRQLKGMLAGPPAQEDLRGESVEQQEIMNRLEGVLFRALSDGVIDASEGATLIEVLQDVEADVRDLRLQLQHAHHSDALPEAGAA